MCPSYHNPADYMMEVATGEYGRHHERMVEAARDPRWWDGVEKNAKKTVNSKEAATAAAPEEEKSDDDPPPPPNNGEVALEMPEVVVTKSEGANGGGGGGVSRVGKEGNSSSDEDCSQSLLGGSVESMDSSSGGSFPTSTWTQFRILFVRTFRSIVRDRTLTNLRLVSQVAVGVLLGSLYWKIGDEASKVYNNSAMLFFCMLFSMFAAMVPTVMTFPLEMTTFKREHLNYW